MTNEPFYSRKFIEGLFTPEVPPLAGENLDASPGDLYDEGPSLADLMVKLAFTLGQVSFHLKGGVSLVARRDRLQLGDSAHAEMTAAGLRSLLLRAHRKGWL